MRADFVNEVAKKRCLDFKCEKSNADYIEFGGGNKTCTFKIWRVYSGITTRIPQGVKYGKI